NPTISPPPTSLRKRTLSPTFINMQLFDDCDNVKLRLYCKVGKLLGNKTKLVGFLKGNPQVESTY
ncbi:MAG: hypothetical protein MSH18_08565, partial [Bacteroidales bacterium]|nr:hypothetical protein [Bacteroidales bacterium]